MSLTVSGILFNRAKKKLWKSSVGLQLYHSRSSLARKFPREPTIRQVFYHVIVMSIRAFLASHISVQSLVQVGK